MSKILVVDDDEDILYSIDMILKMNGFEVVCLYDCHRVIETVQNEKPDLILLDINLGPCNGRDICLMLKTNHHFKNPILLFSAKTEDTKNISLYKADDFMEKPFSVKELVTTIREHTVQPAAY